MGYQREYLCFFGAKATSDIALRRIAPRSYYLYTPTPRESEDPLAKRRDSDSTERMIRPGFLDIESRQNLIELA
ncbi:MAG: hypothetical protein WB820_22690, partial [Rhodoplanes sp.]